MKLQNWKSFWMALALFPVWNSLARVKVGVSHGHWHGCFWLEAILVWASPESKPSTRIWMQIVYVGMILGSRMWEEGEQVKKKTKIMVHFQSQCIGNRCLILLGSSKRQSKICLQELCFQKTKDWDICFLAPGSHWLRVVPGCTDTLTLVGYVCLQSRQLLQSGRVTEGSLLVMAWSQDELHDWSQNGPQRWEAGIRGICYRG